MILNHNKIIIISEAGRGKSTAARLAEEVYTTEKRIVEGTTQWLLQPGLKHADIIIFLTFKTILHQWISIIARYISGRDYETFWSMIALLKHVFYKRYGLGHKKSALTHRQVIAPYTSKMVELKSFKEIDDFILSATN